MLRCRSNPSSGSNALATSEYGPACARAASVAMIALTPSASETKRRNAGRQYHDPRRLAARGGEAIRRRRRRVLGPMVGGTDPTTPATPEGLLRSPSPRDTAPSAALPYARGATVGRFVV